MHHWSPPVRWQKLNAFGYHICSDLYLILIFTPTQKIYFIKKLFLHSFSSWIRWSTTGIYIYSLIFLFQFWKKWLIFSITSYKYNYMVFSGVKRKFYYVTRHICCCIYFGINLPFLTRTYFLCTSILGG